MRTSATLSGGSFPKRADNIKAVLLNFYGIVGDLSSPGSRLRQNAAYPHREFLEGRIGIKNFGKLNFAEARLIDAPRPVENVGMVADLLERVEQEEGNALVDDRCSSRL